MITREELKDEIKQVLNEELSGDLTKDINNICKGQIVEELKVEIKKLFKEELRRYLFNLYKDQLKDELYETHGVLKWNKYKTREEVLSDLKILFDKYGIKDVGTTNIKFWENGNIIHFYTESTDPYLIKNLENDLDQYYFDLDEFPDGCCSALVFGKDPDEHNYTNKFYNERVFKIFSNGEWIV